jgi:hypothetical protein
VPVFPAASFAVTVRTFDPGCSAMPDADQLVVPVAVPLPPALLLHVTCVTPMLSAAVPPIVRGLLVAVYVDPDVGVVTDTVGAVVSYVTVRVAVPALPAASFAVTVSTFVPGCSAMPDADQLVVPVAVPLPPALLLHVTCVTPTLSAAVPPSVSGVVRVEYVAPDVGEVMLTVGGVVSGGV